MTNEKSSKTLSAVSLKNNYHKYQWQRATSGTVYRYSLTEYSPPFCLFYRVTVCCARVNFQNFVMCPYSLRGILKGQKTTLGQKNLMNNAEWENRQLPITKYQVPIVVSAKADIEGYLAIIKRGGLLPRSFFVQFVQLDYAPQTGYRKHSEYR